jgi:uncharacterized protein (DUF58 family)
VSALFDSEFLKKIEQMSLHIHLAMDGASAGNRKSRSKGSSVEFSDYREYTHGDDFRRVDWNAFGRFEKLFIKLFMEEREAPVSIFLDVSKSMDWGEPNKSIASRRLAAALSYVSLSSFDRVSLFCVDETIQAMCRDVRGKNFFHRVTSLLENVEYSGKSNMQAAVEGLHISGTKGITVLISDFFTQGSFNELIKYCKYKKQEVYVCHILSPQELEPDINESIRLIDSETKESIDITVTPALLDSYCRAVNVFRNEIEKVCFKWGANYYRFSSAQLLEEMIKEVAGY